MSDHLGRVSERIAEAILAFCGNRTEFHADDLRRYVREQVGEIAPSSPDRVLRELRKKGRINYRVKNRRESLYEVVRDKGEVADEIANLKKLAKEVFAARNAEMRATLARAREEQACRSRTDSTP